MASPSYTYTLANSTTADASQVMQDFNDILNGVTDGTKDLSISALTCAGTATLNGHVNLGNSSADDLTITASLASSLAIKTNNTYDIGSATLGLRKLYLGNGGAGATCDIVSASHATTREYTVPDCSAAASFVMTESAQTVNGVKTFASGIVTRGDSANSSQATAHSLTADSASVIFIASPASAINQDLPTTNVKKGKVFELSVTGATTTNTVTLRSSGGNTIDIIAGAGVIRVIALQDTPTTAAHWGILYAQESLTSTSTSSGLTSNQTLTFNFTRHGKTCTVSVDGVGSNRTKDGSNGPIAFASVIPNRFLPARTQNKIIYGSVAGSAAVLHLAARTTAAIDIYKSNATTGAAANFGAGETNIGFDDAFTITYDII